MFLLVCSRKPPWDYQWIPRSSLISFYAFDQLCRHLYLPLLRKRPLPQQLFPAQQGSVSLGWLATFASKSPMKSGAFDKPICIQRTRLVHTLKIDGGCFFSFFSFFNDVVSLHMADSFIKGKVGSADRAGHLGTVSSSVPGKHKNLRVIICIPSSFSDYDDL